MLNIKLPLIESTYKEKRKTVQLLADEEIIEFEDYEEQSNDNKHSIDSNLEELSKSLEIIKESGSFESVDLDEISTPEPE